MVKFQISSAFDLILAPSLNNLFDKFCPKHLPRSLLVWILLKRLDLVLLFFCFFLSPPLLLLLLWFNSIWFRGKWLYFARKWRLGRRLDFTRLDFARLVRPRLHDFSFACKMKILNDFWSNSHKTTSQQTTPKTPSLLFEYRERKKNDRASGPRSLHKLQACI